MVTIQGKPVRMIALQFNFSNRNAVPERLRETIIRESAEQARKRAERERQPTGQMIIEPTDNCRVEDVVLALVSHEYELIDARCEERYNLKIRDIRGNPFYYTIRFVFVPEECVVMDDHLKKIKERMVRLLGMCQSAFWRVRVFANPFYSEGMEIPDTCHVSVNLEHRIPRFRPDGEPEMRWPRDAAGNKVVTGDPNDKVPLAADGFLSLTADDIHIVKLPLVE